MQGVIGAFAELDSTVHAIEDLKKQNFSDITVYSPTPRHELEEAIDLLRGAEAAPRDARDSGAPADTAERSLLRAVFQDAPVPLLIDERQAPDIAWVARMGAIMPEGQSPPKPLYLRAPDAQPQDAARLPRR